MAEPTLPGMEALAPPSLGELVETSAAPGRIVAQVRAQVAAENRAAGPSMGPGGKAVSADRRRTRERQALLDAGWHPLTRLPLIDPEWARSCGDCRFATQVGHHRRTYWKCRLVGDTRGPGTDLRVSWPACSRFEEEVADA